MARNSSTRAAAPAKKAAATEPEKAATPKKLPKDVLRVTAVIRPMYAPDDGILIPEGGIKGVLIKKSSWALSQLERGLLRLVE